MAFLTREALEALGFRSLGQDVKISEKASIYNPEVISIGDYCRIDDYAILSGGTGGITIGRNVHIACFCSLIGKERIILEDFAGLSSRVAIYSSSDDYSGDCLTNPTVPECFRKVDHGPVHLGRHAIVGAGAVILPGVTIGEGASAVGALSLVLKDVEPFSIVLGIPMRKIGARKSRLLELEKEMLNAENGEKK